METDRIARDPRSELVLLWVDAANLPLRQAAWGDSDALQAGDWVLAVGRTAGRGATVSAGIACESRSGRQSGSDDLIRTDAVINGLNAGGPLVNLEGKVVGINLARGEPGSPHDGFSQAIPGSLARRVATELAGFGRVRSGFLGLVISGDEPASLNPRDTPPGLLITGITAGGPADQAGREGRRQDCGARRPAPRRRRGTPTGGQKRLRSDSDSDSPSSAESRMEIDVQTAERPEGTGAPAGPLRPIAPGLRGRPRPRDSAPGQAAPSGTRRQGGVLRSEPADDSPASSRPRQPAPAPQPGSSGSGAERKSGKPEPAPEAAPEPDPSLPPALDPEPSHFF